MIQSLNTHSFAKTQPASDHSEAGSSVSAGLDSAGFAPSVGMSASLQGAVQLAMPIHVKPNLSNPSASPVAGFRTPGTKDAKGKNSEWWQSPQGRISTRLFSRGVAGSFMYAMASILVEQALQKYDPSKSIGDISQYGARGSTGNGAMDRFVRGLARGFDLTLGKAISKSVKAISGNEALAQQAITFRETRGFGVSGQLGRSLGHEIVDVAFNFSAASIGDALGRNFAQWIDPHKEISWLKGGKFDAKKCMLAQGKAIWRILSYNQGEDWAVTPIYVYIMKAQRNLIDRTQWGRGFNYVFDHGNTDAYRVNDKGQVVGDYYWQNALDYQMRFTNYNVLTLVYREVYNSIGDRFNHWVKTGELALPKAPGSVSEAASNFLGGVHDVAAYLGRSIMKGYLLMAFTVPVFSAIRIPQARHRALAINPDHGPIMMDRSVTQTGADAFLKPNFRSDLLGENKYSDGNHIYDYTAPSKQMPDGFFTDNGKKLPLHFQDGHGGEISNPFAREMKKNTHALEWFNPYEMTPKMAEGKTESNWIGRRLSNTIGRISYNISNAAADKLLSLRYGMRTSSGGSQEALYDDKQRDAHLREVMFADRVIKDATTFHINSAISYTPYFAAKTEFAELWDKRETDQAMDRLMHGALSFNPKEFVAGVGDTFRSIIHPGQTAGLGSVYGEDQSTTTGWMPWSRKEGGSRSVKEMARVQAAKEGMLVMGAEEVAPDPVVARRPAELAASFAARLEETRSQGSEGKNNEPRLAGRAVAPAGSHTERAEKRQQETPTQIVRH